MPLLSLERNKHNNFQIITYGKVQLSTPVLGVAAYWVALLPVNHTEPFESAISFNSPDL